MDKTSKHVVVAITGASGTCYGLRLMEWLLQHDVRITALVSSAGGQVLSHETGLAWPEETGARLEMLRGYFNCEEPLQYYEEKNLLAPVASGSAAPDAVVVVPCSMGSLARIAAGISDNLIERVADVALKEHRPLILVPRETPLNALHLENMLRLARAGACILPAMPAFYHQPGEISDLIDFVVGKILDSLGEEHHLFQRWGSEPLT
jgi:4-hydroxy-3-polyprenylbenzoate decarboxylase